MSALLCRSPGCQGAIGGDGYCGTCGTRAPQAGSEDPAPIPAAAAPLGGTSLTGSRGTLTTGSACSQGQRRRRTSGSAGTTRTSLGGGLVHVPAAVVQDPAATVLANPEVAEEKRYCAACATAVGRSRGGGTARSSGFCPRCRHPFDFEPKLVPGEIVAGQYQVVGCIAHGGLGWIHLARDKAVDDRWVVLKGLLNTGDEASMAVAVAEKRFLAEIEHGDIVKIHNFVTHRNAGYIVMQYIGGRSLKEILQQRREANGGRTHPLPPDQAIAFVLAALPAFAHLHGRGLVYCDFKPDNLIHVGDHVKLIDLGAVRRIDDPSGDIYGTVGFQAPEIAEAGPSVSSDLYTLGRTLAVLTLDLPGYQNDLRHSLPDPHGHPALERFDSFHRFLLKATAPHPDDRFQNADEMADQLAGVLREVVALTTGVAQPAPPVAFGPLTDDEVVAPLAVDPADPAATFLTNLPGDDALAALAAIATAMDAGQVQETVGVRLRRGKALIDRGEHDVAEAELRAIQDDDPWEWRAVWLRGANALATGRLSDAAAAFDRCWSEVPGELAPKLAAAAVAQRWGNASAAAALHAVVATVDPTYVAAAKGLARCRAEMGDVTGSLAAYDLIPSSHSAFADAQLDAVSTLITAGSFAEAASRLARLEVDRLRRAELDVELFSAALEAMLSGALDPQPGILLGNHRLDERGLREALEGALLAQASLTSGREARFKIVDRANWVRPVTLL